MENKSLILNDRSYEIMKKLVQIVLPALSTLYFTLSAIWDLPYTEQVVGTLAAIAIFLGVVLGLSNKAYTASDARFDGDIVVTTSPQGNLLYSLEIKDDPKMLKDKDELSFKVVTNPIV